MCGHSFIHDNIPAAGFLAKSDTIELIGIAKFRMQSGLVVGGGNTMRLLNSFP
jgi:hypothetical protein